MRQLVRLNGTLAQQLTALQTQLIRMQQMQTRQAPLTGPADNLTTKAVAHAMGLGKEK